MYLLREFTVVMIIANANSAPRHLYSSISNQQNRYPDAMFIIAGDFNHIALKAVLPKLHQHVKRTRGANILDKVYSNIKMGYRVKQLPHLAQSDNSSMLVIPAYSPLRKSALTITKNYHNLT